MSGDRKHVLLGYTDHQGMRRCAACAKPWPCATYQEDSESREPSE